MINKMGFYQGKYVQGSDRSSHVSLHIGGQRTVKVNPADLRFTQDSIASHFKDPHHYLSVREASKHIQRGQMNPDNFPMLRVMSYNGCLWSLDNRRLWVFRMAQCSQITVRMVTKMHPRMEDVVNDQSKYKLLLGAKFLPRVRGNRNVEGISSNLHPRVQDVRVTKKWVATKSPQRVLRETTGHKLDGSFLPPPYKSEGFQPVLVNVSNAKVIMNSKVERPLLRIGSVSLDITIPVLPRLSQLLGRRDSTLYNSSNIDIVCHERQPLLLNGAHSSEVGGRTSYSGDLLGGRTSYSSTPNESTIWWVRFKNLIFGWFGSR